MCACRLEKMHGDTRKYELEDYVYEMESRVMNEPKSEPEDVYSQLAHKEKDLILAAELGKALLDKNAELSRQNEKITEDYTQKLEVLEQEKHTLKQKLNVIESAYESKLLELQTDVQQCRQELEESQNSSRQAERDKSAFISELTGQNQRLTAQLKETSRNEESLTLQLQSMRDQFNLRKSSMQDHVSHLEMMRDEINIITEKKTDLERRIQMLLEEREGLSSTLDDSSDRIMMLERHNREQEQQLRSAVRDLDEVRIVNQNLSERIEMLTRLRSTSPSTAHTSLMQEMDVSDERDSGNGSGPDSGQSGHQRCHPMLDLDESIECDDPAVQLTVPYQESEELTAFRREIGEACREIRSIMEQIRNQRRNSVSSVSSMEDSVSDVKVGLLTNVLDELRGLLMDILRRECRGVCSVCGQSPGDRLDVETDLHAAREELDQLHKHVNETSDESKKKDDQIIELQSQLSIRTAELAAVREERDTLRSDMEDSELAKDEIVKKAWDTRDQAVARKNNCEIELAKTRIDVMQVNSQLLEAIQQKVELSQQLEQWQVDMQQLLDDQMRMKLMKIETREMTSVQNNHSGDSTAAGRKSRLLRLFQR